MVAPTIPTNLKATTQSSSQINLVWEDVATETGYEVERSTDGKAFTKITDVSANVVTFEDKGLPASTKFFYRIRAKNSAGNSDFSNTAEATTTAPPVTSILTPMNLRLSSISLVINELSLVWDDKATDETGYEVSRSTNTNSNFEVIKADLPANSSTFTDKPVRSGNKYFYRVRAIRNTSFSEYSNVLEAIAPLVSSVSPNQGNWTVFPNPVSESINLELDENKDYNIVLYNFQGFPVKEFTGRSPKNILVTDLPSGSYVLKIDNTTQSKSFKIIKQ